MVLSTPMFLDSPESKTKDEIRVKPPPRSTQKRLPPAPQRSLNTSFLALSELPG